MNKFNYVLAWVLVLMPCVTLAQTPQASTTQSDDTICYTPDVPAHFYGGDYAWAQYVDTHKNYSGEAYEKDISGIVKYEFIVEKDGSLTNLTPIKKAHPLLDEEARRILSSCPRWAPAYLQGIPVRSKIRRSITFLSKHTILARYPGGLKAMNEFIKENLAYPTNMLLQGKRGTVICEFTVLKDGSIGDIQCIESPNPEFTKAVIDLIKKFPLWIPGEVNGEKVNVMYTLPVGFEFKE